MGFRITVRQQRPTPLMDAVQKQDVDAVRSRIEAGDAIDDTDSFGQTALHWAAKGESAEIVRRLLDAGADTKAKDEDGDTPLDTAKRKGRHALAEVLAQAAAERGGGKQWWQFWK